MALEYKVLLHKRTWDLVLRTSHQKVIGYYWVFKTKELSFG